MAQAGTELKNKALATVADALIKNTEYIIAENDKDIAEAVNNGIRPAMVDRLKLTAERIAGMAEGLVQLCALPDPVGETIEGFKRPNGLEILKKRVPIGVLGIIFESRPNVTADAAGLCIKSGNACILRGGKEAIHSNLAIASVFSKALAEAGLPADAVQLIDKTDREIATGLMRLYKYVDVLIPRGGAGLIRSCVENALVPCIQTGTGICHIYVDDSADLEKALNIIENAKMSRPSVCNAAEVCLVHKDVAAEFLPKLKARLTDPKHPHPAQLRLDGRALAIIDGVAATEEDFDTEFLDYVLAVKVVDSTADAIAHIGTHSTHHSDAIITENDTAAQLFTRLVDSAAVYVNASTRFTDGGQFGLGCEMGISTQKLHARGPMGLEELTTYKYVVKGSGQIR